jgi:hypothetical protein
VYAHDGKGILLFPKMPYTSLVNSRYEMLRRNLQKKRHLSQIRLYTLWRSGGVLISLCIPICIYASR